MKVVTYHITIVLKGNPLGYITYRFQVEEKTETTSIHKYEAFLGKLEEISGYERHKIIIVNSLKFE